MRLVSLLKRRDEQSLAVSLSLSHSLALAGSLYHSLLLCMCTGPEERPCENSDKEAVCNSVLTRREPLLAP